MDSVAKTGVSSRTQSAVEIHAHEGETVSIAIEAPRREKDVELPNPAQTVGIGREILIGRGEFVGFSSLSVRVEAWRLYLGTMPHVVPDVLRTLLTEDAKRLLSQQRAGDKRA